MVLLDQAAIYFHINAAVCDWDNLLGRLCFRESGGHLISRDPGICSDPGICLAPNWLL